ncbi:MAG: ABC transporter substrate-binding protein [Gammaproteobacteria bacterium]|nr:ABC transporter substrate-binding protein [Gammaproteobacteria bacterium]
MSGLWTLFYKEILRFWKVSLQTILSPLVTTLLYLLIFSHVLEAHVQVYPGVGYASFLIPGLVMMAMLQNAFANSSSSLIQSKFRTLLVRTYSSSLAAYKGHTIDYRPLKMQPGDTDVTVRTVVTQPGGQPPIPIDYSMQKNAEGWKVYDVVVDNVSLVTNYRSSFNSEIRQSGIDGLIKTLADKNRTAEGPAPSKG